MSRHYCNKCNATISSIWHKCGQKERLGGEIYSGGTWGVAGYFGGSSYNEK